MSVGILLEKKVGDYVKIGEPLAYIHANDHEKLEAAKERFYKAYTIKEQEKPVKQPFIKGILS